MAGEKPRSVDSYVAALDDDCRAIAEALRQAIRSAEPDTSETFKWGQPVYDVNGPFAALKAFPRWVTLTFWRGAALADPDGPLEGGGDRMRHARFKSAADIDADAVTRLVREAAALNRELGDPTKRG
jgi:hypothetical protein